MGDKAAIFAAVFAAMYVGHQVGDLWVQTHRQALGKAAPGWPGRHACAKHVLTLTATIAFALVALHLEVGVRLQLAPLAIGLAVNAVSHYFADRRTPFAKLIALLEPGTSKMTFYRLGAPRPGHDDNPTLGTGAYQLDQSWHVAWLFISALIIVA